MSFVIDASISAALLLPDEFSAGGALVGRRVAAEGAIAPDLYWHEIRNLLLLAVRRQRMTEDRMFEQMSALAALPIRAEVVDGREVARLASKHRPNAYDAAYLALSKFERLPLASLDKSLRTAAASKGVALLPDHF